MTEKPMKSDSTYLTRAALLEGTTLLGLVGVAEPLKHIGGHASLAAIAGTIHGVAFLFYWWLLVRTATAENWPRKGTLIAAAAAVVPFGAWYIARRMRARECA